ncbi:hypothetical protein BG023_112258 [Porphyrobacter sp. LM 6]|nr:hypothetical protein BG023_112258 [Porphyrobacter sp. LM 6]
MPTLTEKDFQAQDSLKDRSITIKVSPVLNWIDPIKPTIEASSIGFTVIASDPAGTATVDTSGSVNISQMPAAPGYDENIDITLLLDTSNMRDANGNLLTGDNTPRWAKSDEGTTYTDSKGKTQHCGYGWFCEITNYGPPLQYQALPPIDIAKMAFKRKDDLNLVIEDKSDDGSPPYAFKFGFVLPGQYNEYFISIDPVLSTKSTRTTSFMLKD